MRQSKKQILNILLVTCFMLCDLIEVAGCALLVHVADYNQPRPTCFDISSSHSPATRPLINTEPTSATTKTTWTKFYELGCVRYQAPFWCVEFGIELVSPFYTLGSSSFPTSISHASHVLYRKPETSQALQKPFVSSKILQSIPLEFIRLPQGPLFEGCIN